MILVRLQIEKMHQKVRINSYTLYVDFFLLSGPQIFTFLLYDGDENNDPKVYEVDYPMNCCGCLGAGCACNSKTCVII